MSIVNPYLLPNPSVVSFSGGRTSGYMLRKILDAFGGKLPAWVKVIFDNTGKEKPQTLDFVERCSQQWGVEIIWVEYRSVNGKHSTIQVDYSTASRAGEPFNEVIKHFLDLRAGDGKDPILPNPVQRFCTAEMKVRSSHRYITGVLGWPEYTNAIGLRADEPKRVAAMMRKRTCEEVPTLFGSVKEIIRGATHPAGLNPCCPLSDAGVTESDVMAFWGGAPFDLELEQHEGNCDLCFLKNTGKILRIMRDHPELAEWWIEQEATTGQTFRKDRPSYAELLAIAQGKQDGPGWLWAADANGSCGELDECRCTD